MNLIVFSVNLVVLTIRVTDLGTLEKMQNFPLEHPEVQEFVEEKFVVKTNRGR